MAPKRKTFLLNLTTRLALHKLLPERQQEMSYLYQQRTLGITQNCSQSGNPGYYYWVPDIIPLTYLSQTLSQFYALCNGHIIARPSLPHFFSYSPSIFTCSYLCVGALGPQANTYCTFHHKSGKPFALYNWITLQSTNSLWACSMPKTPILLCMLLMVGCVGGRAGSVVLSVTCCSFVELWGPAWPVHWLNIKLLKFYPKWTPTSKMNSDVRLTPS